MSNIGDVGVNEDTGVILRIGELEAVFKLIKTPFTPGSMQIVG